MAWDMGTREDGMDSVARVVAPRSHWPEMKGIILVVSAEKKGVSSTTGMQATLKTSALFQKRSKEVVPAAMAAIEVAIQNKDFESFGRITMRESNSFHATCLDTEPPIFYLNDVSRAAIKVVEEINQRAGKIVAAYTFDAGPNAVVYHLEENENIVAGTFKGMLATKQGWDSERGRGVGIAEWDGPFETKSVTALQSGISRVILTAIGEGPISVDDHLIESNGEPVKVLLHD